MIVVLQRPTRAARYIATCRLKHAGCELPSPRVGPSRAETIASISARDMRRTGTDEGAKDWDAILRTPCRQGCGGSDELTLAVGRDFGRALRPHAFDDAQPFGQL